MKTRGTRQGGKEATRRVILCLASCLVASCFVPSASAQTLVRYDNILLNARGGPVPFASVAVCTQPAVTTTRPCSPLATAYSDSGGLTPANPMLTDASGNYHFYIAPSACGIGTAGCTIQWYGTGVVSNFTPDVTIGTAGSGTATNLTGPGVITGTFSGNHTDTGIVTDSNASSTYAGNAATATAATSATTATTATNLTGPGAITGTFSGNPTLTGNVTSTAGQNVVSAAQINSLFIVDDIKYTTCNAAITAAGTSTTGSVLVPAAHSINDLCTTNPNGISVMDMRLGMQKATAPLFNLRSCGAKMNGINDDTTAVQNCLAPPLGLGAFRLYAPQGMYRVNPNVLTTGGASQFQIQGEGPMASQFQSLSAVATTPVFTIGNGVQQPLFVTLRDIGFDCNNAPANPCFNWNGINITDVENVLVQHFSGTGMSNVVLASPLFTEMYFRRLAILCGGVDGSGGQVGIAANFVPSGNLSFSDLNVEDCKTGLIIKGGGSRVNLAFSGTHFERITDWALDAGDATITGNFGIYSGNIRLDQGVVGSTFTEGGPSGLSRLVDNGMGNGVSVGGTPATAGLGFSSPGTSLTGDEWLRAPAANPDPVFMGGSTGWTLSNATIQNVPIGIPGIHYGQSLEVTGTLANGYAQSPQYTVAAQDYLVTVGFIVAGTNSGNARFTIINQASTVLFDSGQLSYSILSNVSTASIYRFIRQWIPNRGGTNTSLAVRIYSVNSGQVTTCPLILITQSPVSMVTDLVVAGTSSLSGAGATQQVNIPAGAGNTAYIAPTTVLKSGFMLHFVANVPGGFSGAGGSLIMNINADFNQRQADLIALVTGTNEYTMYIPYWPSFVKFEQSSPYGAGTAVITNWTISPVPSGTTLASTGLLIPGDGVKVDSVGRLIDTGSPAASAIAYCTNTSLPAGNTVSGTVAETVITSNCKIPAGTLYACTATACPSIRVDLYGKYTTAGIADTVTTRLKVCQVSGCASGTVVILAATPAVVPGVIVTNNSWAADSQLIVLTVGASGTSQDNGTIRYNTAASTSVSSSFADTGATWNTTVDEYISLSIQNSVVGDSVTVDNIRVQVQ
jgi:hypothetical protein